MPSMPKATIHEERARPSILLMKRIWPVLLAQTLLGCAVAEVGTKPDGLSTGL